MSKHSLKVSKRTVIGRKVKNLRSKGTAPANIFGKKVPSLNISVEVKLFLKTFAEVGESTLLYLEVEGEKEPRPVFVREMVKDPVSGNLLHVVFNQVNLKEKVTAPVPVILSGTAPAETEKLGILVQQLDEIEIEALPADMPENISIDISGLSEVGANISVADLKLDKKFEVKTDPDTIIVQIEALAKEEIAPAPIVAEGEVGPAPVEGEPTPSSESPKDTTEKSSKE